MDEINEYDIDDISNHQSIADNDPIQISNVLMQAESEDAVKLLRTAMQIFLCLSATNIINHNRYRIWHSILVGAYKI